MLERSPLALLMAMLLDQQVPMEKAFHSPFDLKVRMGGRLDATDIADADPDELAALFAERPALHRFPGSMAGRTQEMCRRLVEQLRRRGRSGCGRRPPPARSCSPTCGRCPVSASRRRASSWRCWPSGSTSAHPAGTMRPASTAGPDGSRWPTSTARGLGRVRAYKQATKAAARAKLAAPPNS